MSGASSAPPSKTPEEYFRDWEGNAFGYGYGTGEQHTLPALKTFFDLCIEGEYQCGYDYGKLEAALSPTVAWLLINALCKCDVIEYGSSPRRGWLTKKGKRLKQFVSERTCDELYELVCRDDSYTPCYYGGAKDAHKC